jgi:hypothetical protein
MWYPAGSATLRERLRRTQYGFAHQPGDEGDVDT